MRKLFLLLSFCVSTIAVEAQELLDMLSSYETSYGSKRKEIANRMLKKAYEQELVDTTWIFDSSTPKELQDFLVYYAVAYEASDVKHDNALAIKYAQKALEYKSSAIALYQLSDCYYLLGEAYLQCSEMGQALSFMQKAYEADSKMKDSERMSFTLNAIAGIYLSAGLPSSAKDFILRAIQIERKRGDKARLATRLGMASEIFLAAGNVEEAEKYAREALHLDIEGGRKEKEAIRRSQLAEIYIALNDIPKAKSQTDIALDVLRQSDNPRSLAICLQQKGRIAIQEHSLADAERFFSESLQIAKEKGIVYLEARAHRGLWESLRISNPSSALIHLEAYSTLNDSLYKISNAHQFNIFKAEYDKEEQRIIHETQQERQRLITYIVSLISVLLLLTIGFLIYSLHSRQRTNSALREAEQNRTRFFRNVTHEFRTPLTLIRGLSDDIRKGGMSPKDTEQKGETAYQQANNLLVLINQLLDISKIRHAIGEPDWHRGDIVPLARMVVESHKRLADSKRLKLVLHTDTSQILMDFVPHYLTTILTNLVSNSIHYTPQYGQINLKLKLENRCLKIIISDTGIGIEAADMPHIFEEFYQAKNHTAAQGTGIGLAMTKQMVEAMRGSIGVESRVGHGTTFTISLPLRNGRKNNPPYIAQKSITEVSPEIVRLTQKPEKAMTATAMEHAPKVLIVEDNDDMANYIAQHLSDKYSLQFAHNGAQALEMTSDILPDLIITDIMMPEMDGYELCRRIRAAEATNHIPIVVISARSDEADRMEGIKSGADAFLQKPFNPEELQLRVGMLLEHQTRIRAKYAFALKTGTQDRPALNPSDQKFLNDFVNLVFKQMSTGRIEVNHLASELCMTRSQLLSRIHTLTGTTTIKYIQQLRLNYAKRLLDAPDNFSVQNVAERCGFVDTAHFASSFKRQFGLTPTQYRRQKPV